ncbi:YraN family protein [Clostridium isatidis]|uniref:UPF0102 protein BEN51_05455 n=1 Tax=Clostridium isatidis TaxID=182773 RepID=A0A343JBM6_9CLOT|nr:YraN family protein [Clostridium isatidis]ASW42934.1 YraN family protein [Clostridium isatidis]
MKNYNKNIGSYGEDIGINFLKEKGYYILDKNFRNKYGEIDVICKFKDMIIFVEVKSRYNNSFGRPMEAITCSKQKKIINLCKYYIYKRKLFNYNCRFDVIEVYFNAKNDLNNIIHIEDAFRAY